MKVKETNVKMNKELKRVTDLLNECKGFAQKLLPDFLRTHFALSMYNIINDETDEVIDADLFLDYVSSELKECSYEYLLYFLVTRDSECAQQYLFNNGFNDVHNKMDKEVARLLAPHFDGYNNTRCFLGNVLRNMLTSIDVSEIDSNTEYDTDGDSSCTNVIKLGDTYLKVSWTVTSWDDYDMSGMWKSCRVVTPVEKTVTVYE